MTSGPVKPPGLLASAKILDLESAWPERLVEAQCLNSAGYRVMAIALRVYCLEIKLKTVICKTLRLEYLPEACKTHDLDRLLIFTGLLAELNDPANDAIKKNWDELAAFSRERLNDLRYPPSGLISDTDSNRWESALDDPTSGVWTWLSQHP